MRKIGIVFAALLALAVVLSACADPEKEPKKTNSEEAAPLVSLLPQEAHPFSSDENALPETAPQTAPPSTTTKPVTTTPKTVTTTTAPSTTTSAPTVTTPSTTSKRGGIELPDHNWN